MKMPGRMTPAELLKQWEAAGMPSTETIAQAANITKAQAVHWLRAAIGQDITDYRRNRRISALQEVTRPTVDTPPSALALQQLGEAGQAALAARLAELRSLNRWGRFAKVTDFHLPYQDNAAVELTARILEDYQPDLRTAWSDGFEFKPLGKWENNDQIFKRVWDSDPQNILNAHGSLEAVLRDAVPKALAFIEPGNHDERMYRYLRQNAPMFADFTLFHMMREFTNHGVVWLGEGIVDVHLSPGFVTLHGHYATKQRATTAMNHAFDYGYQRSTCAGHVHAFGSFILRGADFDVFNYTVGCHAELQPPYSPYRQNWQQGIGLCDFDPNGRALNFYQIAYHRIGSYLVAYWAGKRYQAKTSELTVSVPALAA